MRKHFMAFPIGVIRSPWTELGGTPIQPVFAQGARGQVVVDPEYAEALTDIEGFDRLWLIYWLDRASPYRPLVTPYLDDRPHGVLATRSPTPRTRSASRWSASSSGAGARSRWRTSTSSTRPRSSTSSPTCRASTPGRGAPAGWMTRLARRLTTTGASGASRGRARSRGNNASGRRHIGPRALARGDPRLPAWSSTTCRGSIEPPLRRGSARCRTAAPRRPAARGAGRSRCSRG